MDQNKSMWLASTKNIGQYRKFKSPLIIRDVERELSRYSSLDGITPKTVINRVVNSVKQSLRVRGINWLIRMRKSFISYEDALAEGIKHLEREVVRNKKILSEHWPDLKDPNTSVESIIKYYQLREEYLKSKIRLESLIHHRKNVRIRLKTNANGILSEL